MEYDTVALSAAVAAMEGGNDKKDEDEMPKPISSKERDKVASRGWKLMQRFQRAGTVALVGVRAQSPAALQEPP